ncbi:MAG: DNA polymerase III subunit alpha, partial [Microthrixaceae bacterium]|nr:DNA polymerase III subunit alpha [Microthrixaceae bacterium]
QRKPEAGSDPELAPVVTQYDMHGVESLGLLKMDFLGLRNLDVISDAVALIKKTRGIDLNIDRVELDDPATFALLQRGEGVGVFQLESTNMRALMRSLAPTEFEDIAALVALYRPGPMAANMHNDYADRKNGRKPIEYEHGDAAEVLGDTYGLMIYQESMMRIAQKFAGYSLAEADNLRKACGKKNKDLIAKERVKFVQGCDDTGYGSDLGTKWFDIIEPFADYAFNKSHAYGYGLVSYQTAYLKANYPAEYLAALLTSVQTTLDKAAVYLAECRVMGIQVHVPDVNASSSDFTPVIDTEPDGSETRSILFGLSAVRNVGKGLVEFIVAERDENGPFEDFYDFCQRVNTQVLNKKTIEALIKAGAFDSMGHSRQGLLVTFEQIIDHTVARRREYDMGVMSLFEDTSADEGPAFNERVTIPVEDFDKKLRLTFEKEMLGLYVSDHPLFGVEAALAKKTDGNLADLAEIEDGSQRNFGGIITGLQRKWTKKGDLMAVFTLEDLNSSVEVMVFPRTMEQVNHLLVDDAMVVLRGRVDKRDDTPKLIAVDLETFEPVIDTDPPLRLHLRASRLNDEMLDRLKELFSDFPGSSEVHLMLDDVIIALPDRFSVSTTTGLVGELRALLGIEAVMV